MILIFGLYFVLCIFHCRLVLVCCPCRRHFTHIQNSLFYNIQGSGYGTRNPATSQPRPSQVSCNVCQSHDPGRSSNHNPKTINLKPKVILSQTRTKRIIFRFCHTQFSGLTYILCFMMLIFRSCFVHYYTLSSTGWFWSLVPSVSFYIYTKLVFLQHTGTKTWCRKFWY